MAKLTIQYDGKPLEIPHLLLSRAMWMGALIAALNVYHEVGDPVAFLAQFGIVFNSHILGWINFGGAVLTMYFRWQARQPLGSLQKKLTPEDWANLEEQVRRKIEASQQEIPKQ